MASCRFCSLLAEFWCGLELDSFAQDINIIIDNNWCWGK